MTTLGEQNEHDGFRFFGSKLVYISLGHLNTSKIHSKFILCQKEKHNFNCSHYFSHCTIVGENLKNSQQPH